jgi:phospholipase C
MASDDRISRRRVLQGLAAGSGLVLAGCTPWPPVPGGRRFPGQPGDRPDPAKPEGTDMLPQIDHIVVYMQENHSYDSYFGMYRRGDGYDLDGGRPLNRNRTTTGEVVRVFHAPDTCQSGRGVSQSWRSTHLQIDGGRMDGFLFDDNTNAMRYWDGGDVPFYWSLADTFGLCDRWFASAPAQTYPNRLFLQAATCQDLIATDARVLSMPHPANGTIWEKLDAFGIPWLDYCWDLPDIALFPKVWNARIDRVRPFAQFLTDCRAGTLPAVTIVSPGVTAYTEENPRDIQLGEAYSAAVVDAVLQSPAWPRTVLVFTYDEHGGYYDHVAPPRAVPPDDIPPAVEAAPGAPAAWDHYGLRVPAFVISPYSRPGHVSHVVYDHTSILRLIETKFNLGALTRRDANAANLLDCLDLRGAPAFPEPPPLALPALPAGGSACQPETPAPPGVPGRAGGGAGATAPAVAGLGVVAGTEAHALVAADSGPGPAEPALTPSQDERLRLLAHLAAPV